MNNVKQKWNKVKNKTLLWLGFTLINRHGFTVYYDHNGEQVKSNCNRKKDYSMDDDSWKIYRGNLYYDESPLGKLDKQV